MDSLRLLGDLAEAAAHAHTRRAVTLRLAEALGGHLPVRRVDAAFADAHGVVVFSAMEGARGLEVTEAPGGPLGPGERPTVERSGRGTTVEIPVVEDGEPRARVTVALGANLELSNALVLGLGRIVAVAVSHCRLVERVAALSRRAHVESAELRRRLDAAAGGGEVIARSRAMLSVLERVDLVAAHDTTVLLLGESGTGKELLARRVHARSPRAEAAFLQVNCGAIPESLVESELFGHEKGAFTGASARHLGLFERASGGTLLLDEVAELPRRAQVKLLRVLQEGTIERVGGERSVRVNVRVIAATHRPLAAMVKRGKFREDLYYRLAVFPVTIPPLRERRDDVPLLVHHLLGSLAARIGVTVPRVSAATLAELAAHDWPGNVRELSNLLERSLILSRGGDLAVEWPPGEAEPRGVARSASTASRTLEQATRACIEAALGASAGRIYGPDGAAAKLGLRPSTLQSKMAKLGLSRARFVRPTR